MHNKALIDVWILVLRCRGRLVTLYNSFAKNWLIMLIKTITFRFLAQTVVSIIFVSADKQFGALQAIRNRCRHQNARDVTSECLNLARFIKFKQNTCDLIN